MRALVGGLVLLSSVTAARAGDDLNFYDTTGTFVGTYLTDGTLRRQFSNGWQLFNATPTGLNPAGTTFFYTSTNCTGQRYFWSTDSNLVPFAGYEGNVPSPGTPASVGKTIWGMVAGTTENLLPKSFWPFYAAGSTTPACWQNYNLLDAYSNPEKVPLTAVIPIDSKDQGFHPPFCPSTTAIRCR